MYLELFRAYGKRAIRIPVSRSITLRAADIGHHTELCDLFPISLFASTQARTIFVDQPDQCRIDRNFNAFFGKRVWRIGNHVRVFGSMHHCRAWLGQPDFFVEAA